MTVCSCPGRKARCPSSSRACNTSTGVAVDTGVGSAWPSPPPLGQGPRLESICSPATCPKGPGGYRGGTAGDGQGAPGTGASLGASNSDPAGSVLSSPAGGAGWTGEAVWGTPGWSGVIPARRRLPLTEELATGNGCPLSDCLQRGQHLHVVVFVLAALLLGDPGGFGAWGTELGEGFLFQADLREHNGLSPAHQHRHLTWSGALGCPVAEPPTPETFRLLLPFLFPYLEGWGGGAQRRVTGREAGGAGCASCQAWDQPAMGSSLLPSACHNLTCFRRNLPRRAGPRT